MRIGEGSPWFPLDAAFVAGVVALAVTWLLADAPNWWTALGMAAGAALGTFLRSRAGHARSRPARP